MPSNIKGGSGASKSVTCSICQKKFSRTDHLKRHQLRHSGVKPYACVFCQDAFTRSDNLRDHYPSCLERRNRTIPDPARGGRRSHACDSCTSMKLGCDGNSPCKTCRHKETECKYSRLLSKPNPSNSDSTLSQSIQEVTPTSDRGSIKFLLNSGTASFMECFRFPSSNERKNIANFRNTRQDLSKSDRYFFGHSSENGSTFSDPFEEEPIDWSLFEDENLLRFLSSPFTDNQMQSDEVFAPLYQMDSNFIPADHMNNIQMPGEWEPASPQSAAIVHALLTKATALNITLPEQADINQHLNYLFTPSRIKKLVGHYFEFWHPHCPIVHQPSFLVDTAPIPLLISVIMMGAMYSQVDREVSTAKLLLDIGELLVYSVDDLTDESEVLQTMRAMLAPNSELSIMTSALVFQNLQGAYLMICVQFWAGNPIARKRAIEMRFAAVIKLARKLGLTKVRHDMDDIVDEGLWIQKESRIRLINIMTLIDCAFLFFSNFPCRLTVAEMKFDLPCEEMIFASPHPFSEPNFRPSRKLSTYEAFRSLFVQDKISPAVGHGKKNPLGLNPMDMFILIHLLYVYTHTQISLFSSPISRSPGESGTSTPVTRPGTPGDSNLSLIKAALSQWRSLWTTIRSNIPSHAWATLGFFRNGYNYWLVTQLLINNRGSVDLILGLEVNCEDTLKQLKGLLKDGGNDV